MSKSLINTTHIEGVLYEHALELKTSGPNSKNPGTQFISGTISIATDNDMTNIVPIHFTYVTATNKSGSANATFAVLNNIINKVYGTHMEVGKEKAAKLRIDSAIGLNEFYSDRNGTEELISTKRNEGGFIHVVDVLVEDEKQRNTFTADMLITNCRRVEGDPEKGVADKVIVKGAIFDFRKSLLPVEFSATNVNAMDYFESLGASQNAPVFTKLWGRQISETVVKRTVEESAFGEASVRETRSNRRDWVITGASPEPYVWDDESTMTAAELTKAVADREVYLAGVKQRQDEYKASKSAAPANAAPAASTFNF